MSGREKEKADKFIFLGYPADKQEKATQTVLEQAQLLALDSSAWMDPSSRW